MRNIILCSYLVKLCQCIFYIILRGTGCWFSLLAASAASKCVCVGVSVCVWNEYCVQSACVCVCVCMRCSLASSVAAIFISLRLSSVKVSSTRPEKAPSMTLKALQTIIMACDGCLAALLPPPFWPPCLHLLPVCRSVSSSACLPACLFVRLGNFTISFLSFLSKVLYRNLLYLPHSPSHSRTHTWQQASISSVSCRSDRDRESKTALHIANIWGIQDLFVSITSWGRVDCNIVLV